MIDNPAPKILIINTAFLGDIALTAYLIQQVKDVANAEISVLTTPEGAKVIKPLSAVDNIFVLDKKGIHSSLKAVKEFGRTISENQKFDFLLSLHKSFRTSILVKNIDAEVKAGFKDSAMSYVYDKRVKKYEYLHEAEKYLEFGEFISPKLPADVKDTHIEINISEDNKNYVDNLLSFSGYSENKPLLCLAPGSVWETKKWGNDKYSKLAEELSNNYNTAVIGTEKDKIQVPENIIDLTGKTDFEQLYYLLSISSVLITNDSGPSHFAALAGCKTLTIYGPTSPIFGFYPLSEESASIRNENIACSPCRIHGSSECPISTHECMKSISTEEVREKAVEMLTSSPAQTF